MPLTTADLISVPVTVLTDELGNSTRVPAQRQRPRRARNVPKAREDPVPFMIEVPRVYMEVCFYSRPPRLLHAAPSRGGSKPENGARCYWPDVVSEASAGSLRSCRLAFTSSP